MIILRLQSNIESRLEDSAKPRAYVLPKLPRTCEESRKLYGYYIAQWQKTPTLEPNVNILRYLEDSASGIRFNWRYDD